MKTYMLDIIIKIRKSLMPVNGKISDYVVQNTYYTVDGIRTEILDKDGNKYLLTVKQVKDESAEARVW